MPDGMSRAQQAACRRVPLGLRGRANRRETRQRRNVDEGGQECAERVASSNVVLLGSSGKRIEGGGNLDSTVPLQLAPGELGAQIVVGQAGKGHEPAFTTPVVHDSTERELIAERKQVT